MSFVCVSLSIGSLSHTIVPVIGDGASIGELWASLSTNIEPSQRNTADVTFASQLYLLLWVLAWTWLVLLRWAWMTVTYAHQPATFMLDKLHGARRLAVTTQPVVSIEAFKKNRECMCFGVRVVVSLCVRGLSRVYDRPFGDTERRCVGRHQPRCRAADRRAHCAAGGGHACRAALQRAAWRAAAQFDRKTTDAHTHTHTHTHRISLSLFLSYF